MTITGEIAKHTSHNLLSLFHMTVSCTELLLPISLPLIWNIAGIQSVTSQGMLHSELLLNVKQQGNPLFLQTTVREIKPFVCAQQNTFIPSREVTWNQVWFVQNASTSGPNSVQHQHPLTASTWPRNWRMPCAFQNSQRLPHRLMGMSCPSTIQVRPCA
jgi:hypothetical protein